MLLFRCGGDELIESHSCWLLELLVLLFVYPRLWVLITRLSFVLQSLLLLHIDCKRLRCFIKGSFKVALSNLKGLSFVVDLSFRNSLDEQVALQAQISRNHQTGCSRYYFRWPFFGWWALCHRLFDRFGEQGCATIWFSHESCYLSHTCWLGRASKSCLVSRVLGDDRRVVFRTSWSNWRSKIRLNNYSSARGWGQLAARKVVNKSWAATRWWKVYRLLELRTLTSS